MPDLWPDVLGCLTERYDGIGTILFAEGAKSFRWTSSPRFAPTVREFKDGGWLAKNNRPARVLARGITGFVTESDVFGPGELASDPLFTDLMQPRDSGANSAR